ncbi:hypothetical protein B0T25DRAFT_181767 [Lasiosphaeria hispida]|uniref:Uncharacterized protein n=1 Tax=Lasiosphaeria hispida TaxID=260671 RepID=A0AAJ0HGM7_9PEZI|nr:hypothetical protein B0T25DRAFT_181767 [Lasiosphaeria hispida]
MTFNNVLRAQWGGQPSAGGTPADSKHRLCQSSAAQHQRAAQPCCACRRSTTAAFQRAMEWERRPSCLVPDDTALIPPFLLRCGSAHCEAASGRTEAALSHGLENMQDDGVLTAVSAKKAELRGLATHLAACAGLCGFAPSPIDSDRSTRGYFSRMCLRRRFGVFFFPLRCEQGVVNCLRISPLWSNRWMPTREKKTGPTHELLLFGGGC